MNKSFSKGFKLIAPSRVTNGIKANKGFTLIELLVVISIIAFISSVVMSSVMKARVRARDSQRIQNARQIAIALEQYEATFNTYKVANSGLGDSGSGYVAKEGSGGYTNSILSTLKSSGLYTSTNLTDPVFGDNYYLGLCTSTNAYNIFVKMEQPGYSSATSSISNTCGGAEAATLGFNFIASTAGGASGGGGTGASGGSGFGGAYEVGMSGGQSFTCGVSSIVGQDGFTYGTVIASDTRCWLDRNLGATRVATAYNDVQAYGHLYQWGRGADGHQIRTSGTTNATSSMDTPGHSNFITGSSDWRSPKNDNLWNGINGINNPCPSGFRLPTQPEWSTLISTAGISNRATAYSSSLKLTAAGYRELGNALTYYVGGTGFYRSSNVSGVDTYYMYIDSGVSSATFTNYRGNGFSVRCIKD